MWMPSIRASSAAGTSVASWNSAVERDCPERMPSCRSRSAMRNRGAVQKMKDCWPFGVALRGEIPNRLMLRWLKTVVVSDEERQG